MTAIEQLLRDMRFSARLLRKNPGFTAVAVATLAIGIGVNAMVFTVSSAVLFKGFPLVNNNDRILYICGCSAYGGNVSYPDFQDWRTQSQSFEGMAAVADLRVTLDDQSGFPELYTASQVTANTFQLLGRRPTIGRDFTPADETPGATPVAILSDGFWGRRYTKDPSVIGQTVRLNGIPTTVIGIMPPGFFFPQNQDLWVPLISTPDLRKREARGLWFAFGCMKQGVTSDNARAEIEAIGNRLARAYPRTNYGFVPAVHNFHEFFLGPNAVTLYVSLWAAVAFVLLIACANLANLTLARAIGRSREVSVRIALGASRWRILRQLLMESVMLSALGGFFAWWIAKWGVRAYELASANPSQLWSHHIVDYSLDSHVVVYLFAISLATGLFFGLAPALRLSNLDVNGALKNGARGLSGRGNHLPSALVAAEMALAVVLLAGAGVMVRSFLNIYTADLGVDTTNVLTALLKPPDTRDQVSFFGRLKTRLEAIPGVESIAIANTIPTAGSSKFPYELASTAQVDEQRRPKLSALLISPAYFHTLGAALRSGREFNEADRKSGLPVAIVNRWFANKHWPKQEPLGKRLRVFDGKTPGPWRTVIGIAPNIVQNAATRQESDPLVYLPYLEKQAASMWFFARTRVPPGSLATTFRRELQALDPDLTIWLGPYALSERLSWTYWNSRLYGDLFLILALISLLLAEVGLYAVIAHSMSRRTQEIGIRMAIGATAQDIRRLVFMQGMLPLGTGLILGLAASVAFNRLLKAVLVQVSPTDPFTLITAAAILILTALLGCFIPARQAMRVDPMVALRHAD